MPPQPGGVQHALAAVAALLYAFAKALTTFGHYPAGDVKPLTAVCLPPEAPNGSRQTRGFLLEFVSFGKSRLPAFCREPCFLHIDAPAPLCVSQTNRCRRKAQRLSVTKPSHAKAHMSYRRAASAPSSENATPEFKAGPTQPDDLSDPSEAYDEVDPLPPSCQLRTSFKVPLTYGTQEPLLRAQEVRSRNRRAQARYRIRQRAMKRAKDTQEKSMCDTIARLQGDKATLLERNQQLESSLYQLSRRVRAASKEQASSSLTDDGPIDPATAVLANQEQARNGKAKLDSTSAANKPGPLSKAQLLSAPLDELAREVKDIMMRMHLSLQLRDSETALQAAVVQYLQVCTTLKKCRPDALRQLETRDLETCAPLMPKLPSDEKQIWTTIMDISQLTLQQKRRLFDLRRTYERESRALLDAQQRELLQASQARASQPAHSPRDSIHRAFSALQARLQTETELWHTLWSTILTEVLSARQAALWIVLAWPRFCNVLTLADIAEEDLRMAGCFLSVASHSVALSPAVEPEHPRQMAAHVQPQPPVYGSLRQSTLHTPHTFQAGVTTCSPAPNGHMPPLSQSGLATCSLSAAFWAETERTHISPSPMTVFLEDTAYWQNQSLGQDARICVRPGT
ncbi:hypothetical protein WJX84_010145 [Apatococcus fuscideae]|uniref:BZIP domain-containing protein n=1 Tax=Apatococcus fuscideae TaxID=2026836 RepID=A0AAW1T3T2_9CHLO